MTAEQFITEKHGSEQVFSRSDLALLLDQYHAHKVMEQHSAYKAAPQSDAFVPSLTYQEGYEEVREPKTSSILNTK